jgi:hypothetical protein
MENNNNIEFTGKIAKFPKNSKAVNALKFLEHIKVNPNKLWYIVIEDQGTDLKTVKYNRNQGVNLLLYTEKLKEEYIKIYSENNQNLCEKLSKIIVEGNNDFSLIKNIPQIILETGQTLISKIATDLIKLLN